MKNIQVEFRKEYFEKLKKEGYELNGQIFVQTEKDIYIEWLETKLQNKSSNSDYAKCEHDFEPRKTWVHTCKKCGTVQIEKGHFA